VCNFMLEFLLALWLGVSLSLSTYAERLHHSRHDRLDLDGKAFTDCKSARMDYAEGIVHSILGAWRRFPRSWEDFPSCGDFPDHHLHRDLPHYSVDID
jgi:hypothetical protein